MAQRDTVLVTGGSGYLAGWIIAALRDSGYAVRITLRRLERAGELRSRHGGAGAGLEVVAADLLDDAGWPAALTGVRYVVHTAMPMAAKGPMLIEAARAGTLRVLDAAARAGVERVVLTSSGYAALGSAHDREITTDEQTWADLSGRRITAYARAKTLAEQAAWRFAEDHPSLALATVLPGFILGPLQSREISPSMQLIASMLKGAVPALPNIGMSIVDVRDAADLHLRALGTPAAAGERFLSSAGFVWFRDIARLLRAELGADGVKVSLRRMPDVLTRMLALASPQLRELLPNLGRVHHLDSRKAERLLGWHPRPLEQTLLDGARSVLANQGA